MDLSIVIPAFEECRKIARDVEAAAMFLEAKGYRKKPARMKIMQAANWTHPR